MFIPVNTPDVSGNEASYLQECIDTGWISSEGPFVKRLEEVAASQASRVHGVAVCNGTLALELAVQALGLGPGDEVIVPSFTIISCVGAIVKSGATPVLVDADPDTWNMTAAAVEAVITERTKAVMIVHLYGLPVDMDPILALAKANNLLVLEDAAEMIGQTYYGKPCGGFGDISTFSYYPNKHVTTGEGGMILTNNEDLAERCRSLRNLCFGAEERFRHEDLGTNARMSNLQAAIGVAQYERLTETITHRKTLGAFYEQELAGVACVQRPVLRRTYAENIFWVYGIVLEEGHRHDARAVITALAEHGIGSRPFFLGMHEQPVFHKRGLFLGAKMPVTEHLSRKGLYIPCSSGTSLADAAKVVETLLSIL